jgi:LysM repeat protein
MTWWLLAWLIFAGASAVAADTSYIVKRGDSLYSIARSRGISTTQLAERNGLGRNAYVYAGQRLIVPANSGSRKSALSGDAASKRAASALPSSIQRAIDKAPVRAGRWQYIVVHHSDVDTGTMKSMDKYHREVRHMENGLAYHFVIGNGSGMDDGEIGISRRWIQQLDGGHLASESQNKVAIGICLVGNFDEHGPTRKEMESLRALVEALMARCHLTPDAVKTHQQINIVRTRCPGTKFPAKTFLGSLKAPGH